MAQKDKTIIALHGAGMDAGVFGTLATSLPRFQALTFPGHGRGGDALLPAIAKMAEWLRAKLEGHAPQSVVLVGHSMGALVALEAGAHAAVAGIVFLGAAAKMPVHPELLYQAKENPDAAADMILKWGISPVHPQASEIRTVLKRQMQSVPPAAILNDLSACNNYRDAETAAHKLSCAALVVSGLDDKLAKPAEGKILADMIKGGQFHVLRDTGHMMMIEKPLETAQEITGFIDFLES